MKPTVAAIERFIAREELRLGINKVVAPPWVKLIIDIGESAEGVIAAHVAAYPADAACNFIMRTMRTGTGRR
jgi:hypothetical protein